MNIIVADDSALLREGIVGLVQRQGHTVLAAVADAPSLITAVDEAKASHGSVDLVVTDVRMPPGMGTDGLDAALKLREIYPDLGIVILSQYVGPAYTSTLLSSPEGGFGYLLKDRVSDVADFLRALLVVSSGGVVVDPEVAAALVAPRPGPLDTLTEREREVLGLMAEGLSNSEIAKKLVLSPGSVSKNVAAVFLKLGLDVGEENRRVRAVLTYLTAHQPGSSLSFPRQSGQRR